MKKSIRRTVALLILPLFVFSLYPQKRADAFLPAAAAIGIALLDAGGAVVVSDAAMTGLVTLMGAVGMAAVLYGINDSGNAAGQVRVPTTTATGSTTAMAAIAPSAPGTAGSVTQYRVSASYPWESSAVAANTTYANAAYPAGTACSGGGTHWGTATVTATTIRIPCLINGTDALYFNNDLSSTPATQVACTSGYTMVSSVCTLSNARAATADAKADYTRSGTTLAQYSGDDQGPSIKPAVSTTAAANDTVSTSGQDAAGNPRKISVQATADNGSKIQVQTQLKDANGNTYVTNQAITISPGGIVTTVTSVPSAQALQIDPTTGQYVAVSAPTSSATPAAPISITFPSDYARDATVSQLHTDVASLRTDITSTAATAPSDPAVKSTDDISGQLLDSSFSSLKAWTFPARSVSCPAPSFSVWSHMFTIDAHCTLWATVSGQIQAISLVTWALMAMFIVLGA